MRGNTFGKMYSITTFGESHGEALGVVIDGMPSNIDINTDELQSWLDKRRPGRLKVSTSRDEKDRVEILSGIFQGKTLGTPITVIVKNKNQKSADYEKLKDSYRPGHADQTTQSKFGIRDYRGGGRSSGRETLARVIGGYFASLILKDIKVKSFITKMAHFENNNYSFDQELKDIGFSDPKQEAKIEGFLLKCKKQGESCGGIIELWVKNMPKDLGEPVFDKLKADLAKSTLSIGSCVGFTIGAGQSFSSLLGSEVSANTDNFGGVEGGISNGDDLKFQTYFKAPSTIGENAKEGRHDPCILPRVRIVLESMVYITLADHFLRQQAYKKI